MGVWRTIPVKEDPEIILSQWSVREIQNGDRHFVGYNDEGREGRVSSKILEFDNKTMKGKTRSGRIYQLRGEPGPGMNEDAEYVWGAWARINKVESFKDISEEITKNENVVGNKPFQE